MPKLTEAFIRNLPTPTKRTTYPDTASPYFQLMVTPTGHKSFYVYRRIKGGQPERIHIGSWPAISLTDARIAAGKVNTAIELGESPNGAKKALRGELDFAGLFDQYMKIHAKPKKLSWKEDEAKYKQFLEKPLGKLKISHITQADIKAIHRAAAVGRSGSTANRVLALISSIFGFALSEDLVKYNPCRGIKRFQETASTRYLEPSELPLFFKALEEEPNPTIKAFFTVCLFTGVRSGNVMAMRWDELDLDRGVWTIPKTKNGTSQTVTLSPPVVELLNSLEKLGPWVLPGRRDSHMTQPHPAWKRLLARAGLTGLKIHSLRHSLASYQAINGTSLHIIGKSLNHRSAGITMRYAHLSNDVVRESVDAAVARMLSLKAKN